MPSEQRLEQLLCEAWEFMPGPDMARLAEIESRLLHGTRRPARRRAALPWWAILLLAGGTATAAWWVGEIFTERKRAPERYEVEGMIEQEPSPPVNRRTPADTPAADDGSRIIYERETP